MSPTENRRIRTLNQMEHVSARSGTAMQKGTPPSAYTEKQIEEFQSQYAKKLDRVGLAGAIVGVAVAAVSLGLLLSSERVSLGSAVVAAVLFGFVSFALCFAIFEVLCPACGKDTGDLSISGHCRECGVLLDVSELPELPGHIAPWHAEPELAAPIPRACVSVSLWWRPELGDEQQLSKLLVEGGTATRGIIVKRERVPAGGRGSTRSVLQFVIAYEAPARRYIRGSSRCAENGKVGDTVTVLYLPEAPEKAMAYKDCLYKAVGPPEEKK